MTTDNMKGDAGAPVCSKALLERIGLLSDKADNLLHAVQLPLPPAMHVTGLLGGLREIKAELDDIARELTTTRRRNALSTHICGDPNSPCDTECMEKATDGSAAVPAQGETEGRSPNASLDRPAASAGTVGGVVVPGVGPVFVCESCLRGEHQSYGCDHRTGPEDRRDCKNLSADGQRQCLCNPDWPELTKAIRRHNKEVDRDE